MRAPTSARRRGSPAAPRGAAAPQPRTNSRKLIGTSRRRPAPSSVGSMPLLSVVKPRVTRARSGWPHDPGDRLAP